MYTLELLTTQPKSIKTLCHNITKVAESSSLKVQAEHVNTTFIEAFEFLAKCHRRYNSNVVTETDIRQTGWEKTV